MSEKSGMKFVLVATILVLNVSEIICSACVTDNWNGRLFNAVNNSIIG